MTSEQKQILLKDLCARLPYHPTVKIYNDSWEGCKIGEFDNNLYYHHVEAFVCDRIEIKPYLRPLSSMTEEEKIELCTIAYAPDEMKTIEEKLYVIKTNAKYAADFYNEHHFDFRGLIPMGLALETPKDMYKEK